MILTKQLEEYQKICDEATPLPHKVNRYDHGGGRVYVDDGKGGRDLIADFYDEKNRECFIIARTALPVCIEEIRRLREALKEISEGKGRFSQDQFEHCRNTVEDMKEIAKHALREDLCVHNFEANHGLYDTLHRYCTKCGIAE